MWPLLENIFEYISFKHTWEDGTHRTEFKCENCYKIVDIGQNNEISYDSETYTTGCWMTIQNNSQGIHSHKVFTNPYI